MSDEIPEIDKDIINDVIPQVEPVDLAREAPVQVELDINIKEQQKQEKTKANGRDNSYLKKILETPKEQPGGGTSNNDEAKRRLLGESQPLNNTSTLADSGDSDGTAELLVEILDWLLVEGITFYAAADSSKEYETDKEKKKILKKYFAKWLQKKSANYPVEYFLFAAFISTYFISARRAHQDRKINKPLKDLRDRARKNAANQPREDKKKRRSKDDGMEFTPTEEVK